jgi:hypothetical protein
LIQYSLVFDWLEREIETERNAGYDEEVSDGGHVYEV